MPKDKEESKFAEGGYIRSPGSAYDDAVPWVWHLHLRHHQVRTQLTVEQIQLIREILEGDPYQNWT